MRALSFIGIEKFAQSFLLQRDLFGKPAIATSRAKTKCHSDRIEAVCARAILKPGNSTIQTPDFKFVRTPTSRRAIIFWTASRRDGKSLGARFTRARCRLFSSNVFCRCVFCRCALGVPLRRHHFLHTLLSPRLPPAVFSHSNTDAPQLGPHGKRLEIEAPPTPRGERR